MQNLCILWQDSIHSNPHGAQDNEEDLYSAVSRGPNAAGPWRVAGKAGRKSSASGGPTPAAPPQPATKPIPTPATPPQLQPQAQPQAIPSATAVAGKDTPAGPAAELKEDLLGKNNGAMLNGYEASSAPTPQVPNAWNRAGAVPATPESPSIGYAAPLPRVPPLLLFISNGFYECSKNVWVIVIAV